MVEIMVSVPRVVTEVERIETAVKVLHGELGNLTGQVRGLWLTPATTTVMLPLSPLLRRKTTQ